MPRWKNSLLSAESVQRIKREAVLKAAGRAFSARGFHNTSLDDVAKSLNVSRATLYKYVQDKQEILRELHQVGVDIATQAFEEGKRTPGTGAEILRTVLFTYTRLLIEDVGVAAVLRDLNAMRPEDRAEAVKARDSFERKFLQLLKAGIEDGSLLPIEDPKLAVYTFMGAICWVPRWYSAEGKLSSAEVAEIVTDNLFRGLVAEATGHG